MKTFSKIFLIIAIILTSIGFGFKNAEASSESISIGEGYVVPLKKEPGGLSVTTYYYVAKISITKGLGYPEITPGIKKYGATGFTMGTTYKTDGTNFPNNSNETSFWIRIEIPGTQNQKPDQKFTFTVFDTGKQNELLNPPEKDFLVPSSRIQNIYQYGNVLINKEIVQSNDTVKNLLKNSYVTTSAYSPSGVFWLTEIPEVDKAYLDLFRNKKLRLVFSDKEIPTNQSTFSKENSASILLGSPTGDGDTLPSIIGPVLNVHCVIGCGHLNGPLYGMLTVGKDPSEEGLSNLKPGTTYNYKIFEMSVNDLGPLFYSGQFTTAQDLDTGLSVNIVGVTKDSATMAITTKPTVAPGIKISFSDIVTTPATTPATVFDPLPKVFDATHMGITSGSGTYPFSNLKPDTKYEFTVSGEKMKSSDNVGGAVSLGVDPATSHVCFKTAKADGTGGEPNCGSTVPTDPAPTEIYTYDPTYIGTDLSTFVYKLLAPLPGITEIDFAKATFWDYTIKIFKIMIGIAGVLAVLMIVVGGMEYMTSDIISKKESGKDRIWSAVQGLILILGSFIILKTISPNLLNLDLNIKSPAILSMPDPMTFTFPGEGAGSINPDTKLPEGISCPGTSGTANIVDVANSFIGKVTYSQELPKGQIDPQTGKIKLDCSGYAVKVLQCVGLGSKVTNGASWQIFDSTATPITSIDASGASVNKGDSAYTLSIGDLVGWKPKDQGGSSTENSGHVMIYMGNGMVIDSHGGTNGGVTGAYPLNTYKDRIKFVKKITN